MNSKFTDEQIRAYAAQFREGDAIFSGRKWCEVVVIDDLARLSAKKECSKNQYIVNNGEQLEFKGAESGFKIASQDRYRVTTLDDYELQGGEKIVWLGGNHGFKTYGKAYITSVSKVFKEDDVVYVDDDGCGVKPDFDEWVVIPRYEQVKNLGKTTITEQVNEVIKNKMNTDRPASSHYHIDNNGNDVWQFADDNLSKERVKGFHQVNALKYIARYEKKHDTSEKRIEDLEKAKVSIDKLIELEGKSMTSKGCDVGVE